MVSQAEAETLVYHPIPPAAATHCTTQDVQHVLVPSRPGEEASKALQAREKSLVCRIWRQVRLARQRVLAKAASACKSKQ